jgi:4-aminobutyrate aminotransferase-like enzyme
VLAELEDGVVLANCRAMGELAKARLQELWQELPAKVVDVRGAGLLLGCELASAELATDVAARCLDAGVIVNLAQGRVLRLFPCLNISEDPLARGLDVISTALRGA